MPLLETDPFLTELTAMFKRQRDSGSITTTLKRSNMRPKPKGAVLDPEGDDFRCLVRASNGKRHISTTVGAKDYARFHVSYTNLLKAHMDGLKKREKEKKKKKAGAAAAAGGESK